MKAIASFGRQMVSPSWFVLMTVVQLKIEGHLPVLDDTCKVFTKEQIQKDKHVKKLFAMPTSQSSSKAMREEAEDEDQLDELVSDDAQQEYLRCPQRSCYLVDGFEIEYM